MIPRVMVVGGGIAGMQAALDVANSGYEAVLVERLPSIGGHMAQLSETFPTLDCAQCILTPRTVEVGHHDKIKLFTYSAVESVEGEIGAFRVRLRREATYVDWDVCTGCGTCYQKCPFQAESDFERGIGPRKAIYTLGPQAVPNKPVIDPAACKYMLTRAEREAQGKKPQCGACAKLCPTGAIRFDDAPRYFEEEVGAIILATGYDLMSPVRLPEYGGGTIPDVIDGLAFERLLSSSGPTAGAVRRPSDGKTPETIVFVQCAGSRDPERGAPYCSKICCMYTAKQAMLYKHRVHHGQAHVFYIDIRAGGKRYEEFVQRGIHEEGTLYHRGKVSRIYRDSASGKVIVRGADTLNGKSTEIEADLVVLAMAVLPRADAPEVAARLGVEIDANGFFVSRNDEFEPVVSTRPGVYLAGVATGPKDIPETVAQASGAAGKVLSLFRQWEFPSPPTPLPQGARGVRSTK
ncbi:MAG: CoB--CoM heterodisulfide reductase iron-sulfur subunit A family protein [Anaerolineae bacterium]|nr:CoB--CoM heterodisulfide reductase iron-sulfur subunit A family protein [Anaerolineae bacterium]